MSSWKCVLQIRHLAFWLTVVVMLPNTLWKWKFSWWSCSERNVVSTTALPFACSFLRLAAFLSWTYRVTAQLVFSEWLSPAGKLFLCRHIGSWAGMTTLGYNWWFPVPFHLGWLLWDTTGGSWFQSSTLLEGEWKSVPLYCKYVKVVCDFSSSTAMSCWTEAASATPKCAISSLDLEPWKI